MNNNQQQPQETEKSSTPSVQNSPQTEPGTDPRQKAIEQEEDTARLRSEQQSVKDGQARQDNGE